VLDVGCGTGEHALMAAALGCEAVGIDTSAIAIAAARRKAELRELPVRFLIANALELATINEQFDVVLDSGLFHVFDDADRAAFVESLAAVIHPGGKYFLLCFSDQQPGEWGPRRVTQDEIRASFAIGWHVESIAATTMDLTIQPEGARAWLGSITRT
jgi:SAM-dependent methyltransferase